MLKLLMISSIAEMTLSAAPFAAWDNRSVTKVIGFAH